MHFLKATGAASIMMMMGALANPIAAPEAGNELEKRATEGVYLLNCGSSAYIAVVVRYPSQPCLLFAETDWYLLVLHRLHQMWLSAKLG
jgi:hypothetical protein